MYCPNPTCQDSPERPHLLISERSGIEIDYCPRCRGVWLDRGELDKLLERAQAEAAPAASPQAVHQPQQEQYREREYREPHYKERRPDYHHKNHDYGHYGKPRKKSIFSEIFDF
ncbi:TFIIB-type zinc ribbon-containing protein [Cellvibrio japonicus]|uniref:Transcription factor zinc-finger domain-containing protein n=1 Tax=Cellvibrio japonicus (strain Ueda107) TaxID=498211 RepID=B3PKU3_CELJU|nr:zf-TFIIB domain-containing protein [Cellvibrio japonicus]ACE86069.1 conserved hypothetical protein [Cellvibrio japonicus Ueda107]QEI11504.1 hypothetical protein FY117_04160 [Cellvibrio japonicus]QEI15078.1 hypothetical protein FY116_04160 [Cellvibrio japonicus]QEI18658.1 hypothetical protein FY115_04160 [Cellvibrio japonicus]